MALTRRCGRPGARSALQVRQGKANIAPAGADTASGLPLRQRGLEKGPDDRDDRGLGDPAQA
eukprot:565116-Alexandrium_andersonii.AAC.1